MTLNPNDLRANPELLEKVEKASLRLVVQALYEFRRGAVEIFSIEQDRVKTIGEDITREAMDRLSTSVIPIRLSGDVDYKRAHFYFHPDFSLRQALFIDSKAEKTAPNVARVQVSQTSMPIRFVNSKTKKVINEHGTLPKIYDHAEGPCLTTSIFVKYNYTQQAVLYTLTNITLLCIPNGMLASIYNPTPETTIWQVGPDATTLGEKFRARVNFGALRQKAPWRVQHVNVGESQPFTWEG
jgi:hypothetical protein